MRMTPKLPNKFQGHFLRNLGQQLLFQFLGILRFKCDFKLARQKQILSVSWLLAERGGVLIGIERPKLKENKSCHKHACTA